MAKFIVPFINASYWEHNDECRYCKTIDEKIYHIIELEKDKSNFDLCQKLINSLENDLVDGYNLVKVYERNGKEITNYELISELYKLRNDNSDVMTRFTNFENNVSESFDATKTDLPTTLHSRWCECCGARKPDIYDTNRTERMDLLPIYDFNINIVDKHVEINWNDSKSKSFKYAKLFKDDICIYTSSIKDEMQDKPFKDDIEEGTIYKYHIIDYDKYDMPIFCTENISILKDATDDIPPDICTDVQAKYEVMLLNDSGSYNVHDVVHIDYVKPNNDDYQGTELRLGYDYVPRDWQDGFTINNHATIDDLIEDKIYYIKPFPYDSEKAKHHNDGYIYYRNYNLNSPFAMFHKSKRLPDVQNIKFVNNDKSVSLFWDDVFDKNWKNTVVCIKEFDGTPIQSIHDCKIVYESNVFNQHSVKPYVVEDLKNGKKYQIGIFQANDTIMVSQQQIIALPQYVEPQVYFGKEYQFTYMDFFKFDKTFYTVRDTVAWIELEHPLKYGGKLSFDVHSSGLTLFRVYNNDKIVYQEFAEHDWEHADIHIDKEDYCKLVFEVEFEYDTSRLDLKNIVFCYDRYEGDSYE